MRKLRPYYRTLKQHPLSRLERSIIRSIAREYPYTELDIGRAYLVLRSIDQTINSVIEASELAEDLLMVAHRNRIKHENLKR